MNKLLLIMAVCLTGCATTGEPVTRTYPSPKLYNADCLVKGQQYSEANVILFEETEKNFKVKAGDGKVLALPQQDCILSQVPTEDSFPEETPGQYWVKCRLGKMSLVTDGLIFVDDVKHYIRFRRRDGQIWVLPRTHCSVNRLKSS